MNKSFKYIGIILLGSIIILPYFIIIKSEYNISEKCVLTAKSNTISRIFSPSEYHHLLWPQSPDGANTIDGVSFEFSKDFDSNSVININVNGTHIPSAILINQLNDDHSLLMWNYSLSGGNTPWSKINAWCINRKIKSAILQVFNNLKSNVENPKNIYQTNIEITRLSDSTLISIKATSIGYPTTSQIYAEINKLKEYAKINNAVATNNPMLNIKKGESQYFFMVALPINKDLKAKDNIEPKRMLPGGKFLVTDELKGGENTLVKMEKQLENYKFDYSFNSPAIPFQSLVSDRSLEPDSSKWVTKLYYPIF